MSIIHVNQIKNRVVALFDGKIDLSDVDKGALHAKDRESHFLTRALAAYAIYAVGHADIEIAAAFITDGGDDNGIDAIHYDEREKRLYIVQSKWIHSGKGEPENGDVKKFVAGVRDLFDQSFERFNAKVRLRKSLIGQALSDFGTRYQIILAYTGSDGLATPSRRDLDDIATEMNDTSEVLSITVWRQRELHASLISLLGGEPITLDITLQHWGKTESPHTAYYGQVSGCQIVEWWAQHGTLLFTKNLRGVLGDTDVNDDIRRTLEKDPNLFWYFNNGITLISNTVKKSMAGGADRSLGTFRCESVSVVNGAQTVSTIGKYGNTEAAGFDNVSVQLRMISLESADGSFGGNITKTNNRQNRIDNRDFVSLDPEQARIRNELAIDGVQYHLLRSEVISRSECACDLVESTTGLACASGDSGLAVQLKREIGKLWEDLGRAPYRALFNPTVTGMQVWRCVRVQRGIDAQIDLIANRLIDAGGRPFSVAIHGNRIIALIVFGSIPKAQLSDPGADFEPFVSAVFLAPEVARAYEALNAAVEAEYAGSIIPTLFKNATKCKNLYESVTNSRANSPE